MSRRHIRTEPEEVIAGWDAPLQTYFFQIIGPEIMDGEDDLVIWMGSYPGELPTVESLAAVLAPYATLSEELAKELEADKANSSLPTDLQKFVAQMLNPSKS